MQIHVDLHHITTGVPKPLQVRHCLQMNADALRTFGVKIVGPLGGDGDQWALLRIDVSGAHPQAIIQFLESWGVVAVTIEPADVTTFIGNTPASLFVREEVAKGNPETRDIPPDSIMTVLRNLEVSSLKTRKPTADEEWVLAQPGQREAQEAQMVAEMRKAGIEVPGAVDLDWNQKQNERYEAANRKEHDAWATSRGFGAPTQPVQEERRDEFGLYEE